MINKDKVFFRVPCAVLFFYMCDMPTLPRPSKQSPLCSPGWRGLWPTCPNSFELNRLGLGGYDSVVAGAASAAAAREGAWNNFFSGMGRHVLSSLARERRKAISGGRRPRLNLLLLAPLASPLDPPPLSPLPALTLALH